MKLLKIAGAVLNQTPLDWDANFNNIVRAIEEARARQVTVLCLPELCITGYGCEDAFYAPGVHQTALQILADILPYTKDMLVSLGLPVMYQNRIFNAACLVVDGEIAGFVAKRFLAGNGIHYEPRWFTPWPEGEAVRVNFAEQHTSGKVVFEGQSFPLGDLYFKVGGIKIGFEICEDAWVANRPGRKLYQYGVDLILNPSASHFAFGKLETRKRFVLEGSRSFGCGYIYANLLGNESGRAIYDGGTLIASSGNMLAIGQRLSFHDHLLTTAVIDIAEARMAQSQTSTLFNIPKMQENCVEISFNFPQIDPQETEPQDKPWEKSSRLQEEEFSRALALGLYDYMRKSRSKGFVVSLSGGADSAAVVSCCYLMMALGIENIGLEAFKKKLSYFTALQPLQTIEEMAKEMLITAYQPTENSGQVTLNAAKGLADALSATFYALNINEIFKGYRHIIEASLQRPLTWEQDDIALQNIQARVRSPSVWMLANIRGALLLSTSNRSEAAVGYATMDGDTSGGLSPIAGIDKAFLRQWLQWLETEGVAGIWKIPALRAVNVQQPTAELRPQAANQTDEDDLMPYDLLDAVEEAAIRDKKMPIECYRLLKMKFPQYSSAQLKEWTTRFFQLWCRNQWKRERYAPSFHLDDKNLDPKTWCRFPILSGGFVRELAELAAYEG